MIRLVFVASLALCITACNSSQEQDLGRGPLKKADLPGAGSCRAEDGSNHCGGQSDGICYCDDLCDSVGDCCEDISTICDSPLPFNSCGDKVCGDSCTLCDPADPDCSETQVIKQCQPDGSCAATVPTCPDEPAPFDSCESKTCGDSCTLCDPADPDCFETQVIKQCQPDGSCAATVPTCPDEPAPFDSCESKTCGDSCTLCDPADPDCFETQVEKFCQPSGSCVANLPVCQ